MPRLKRNSAQRIYCAFLLLAFFLTLAGCAGGPPVSPTIQRLPERVELKEVPFFAQSAHQGAPGALAALLSQQGVVTTPGLLVEELQLPEQKAQLQLNIGSVVREHGLLVYSLRPNLPALLSQVAAGYPVLLRFNREFAWFSFPRYAVLIGYDRSKQTLLLRSGLNRRWEIDFADFAAQWTDAGQWAVLILSPTQLPPPAAAPIPPVPSEQAAHEAASARTQELLSLHQRWQQAAPQEKQQQRQLLLAQAEQRRQLLAELAKTYPAEVLRVAIPAQKQVGLPAELLALLEEAVEVEGELEVVHIDNFEDPSQSRIEHVLKTPFGERFTLHNAATSAAELQSGQRVRLTGLLVPPAATAERASDGDIVVGSFDEDILSLAASNSASYGTVPGALANSVGEQRTLVLMVNFQDAPSNKPWTSTDMQALFTNQITPFYQEVSYNQTWLKATVFGWQTIATSSSSCDRTAITNLADQAATAAGYTLSNYDRLIYAFPQTSSCGWGGLGTVGGKPSRAWLNGSFTRSAYSHELGHNLGLYHSHDLDCGSTTLGSSCTVREYGDIADTIGAGSGHFNAYQKERLGWFGNSILTVSSSGSYRLAPHEFVGSQPLALKTLKSVDPVSGAKTWYYLEFRQAIGLDSGLSFYSTGNLTKGISIHSGAELNGNTSYLLDMTPDTAAWYDAALVPGARFSDSAAGISITTLSASSSEAQVDISLGAEQCTQNNPSVSLSVTTDNWVSAGTTVSYSLTVSNKDSSSCSSRPFSLSAGVPSGWAKSLSQSALSLAPGASATATLTVTSASGAAAAFYDISASAASGSHSATATAAYVVEAPASNNPPLAKNDSASTSANTAVTIAVLANDSDPDGDSLSVTSVSGGNGSVTLNSDGSLSFTPASGFTGTTSLNYSIADGRGGSASALVSVSVSASNQAPVATNDSASTSADTAVTIAVLANDSDPDGDSLSVTSASGGNGSVTLNSDGSLSFTPASGFSGTTGLNYSIADGRGGSASALVSVSVSALVSVTASNLAPVATNDSASMSSRVSLVIPVLNNDWDPEGVALKVTAVTQGSKGKVSINANGSLTYSPAKSFRSSDSFSYTISDGSKSASATVQVNLLK